MEAPTHPSGEGAEPFQPFADLLREKSGVCYPAFRLSLDYFPRQGGGGVVRHIETVSKRRKATVRSFDRLRTSRGHPSVVR